MVSLSFIQNFKAFHGSKETICKCDLSESSVKFTMIKVGHTNAFEQNVYKCYNTMRWSFVTTTASPIPGARAGYVVCQSPGKDITLGQSPVKRPC